MTQSDTKIAAEPRRAAFCCDASFFVSTSEIVGTSPPVLLIEHGRQTWRTHSVGQGGTDLSTPD
jgi:hypothetical protein